MKHPTLDEMAAHHGRPKLDHAVANTIVQAIILLNDHPRFGPKNRRMHFDSYQVAADLSAHLKAAGWNWQLLSNELPQE